MMILKKIWFYQILKSMYAILLLLFNHKKLKMIKKFRKVQVKNLGLLIKLLYFNLMLILLWMIEQSEEISLISGWELAKMIHQTKCIWRHQLISHFQIVSDTIIKLKKINHHLKKKLKYIKINILKIYKKYKTERSPKLITKKLT
jgi:hypothetical protein